MKKHLTITAAAPVADNRNRLTAGPHGPLLLQDSHLIEKLAHQNRERIPECVVHAKGRGAFGTLTVAGGVREAIVERQLGRVAVNAVRPEVVAGD